MKSLIVKDRAPGTVVAACWLSIAAGLVSVIGAVVTVAQVLVRPSVLKSSVDTGGVLPTIEPQAASVAVTSNLVASVVFALALIAMGILLGHKWKHAPLVLSLLVGIFAVLNVLVGLGLGATTIALALVGAALAWMPASRAFFKSRTAE